MATAKLLLILVILTALSKLATCKRIKIISDFSAESDKKFFATVYPWLVSNVPKLKVKYFFKDGEPGAKRMCAVSVLRSPAEQAQFLQCQAEGKKDCNEKQIATNKGYDICMEKYQSNMKAAAKAFGRYKVRSSPMIVSGLSKMATDNPMVLLKKMCLGYVFFRPPGCKKPSALEDSKNKGSKSKPSKYDQISDSVVSTIGEVNEFTKDIYSEFTDDKKTDDRIGPHDLEKLSNIENLQDPELQKKLLKNAIVGWKMWLNKKGQSDTSTKSDDAHEINEGKDGKTNDAEGHEYAHKYDKNNDGKNSDDDDQKESQNTDEESDDNGEKSDDHTKKSNKDGEDHDDNDADDDADDGDDKKSDDSGDKPHKDNEEKIDKGDKEKVSEGGDEKSHASEGASEPKKS